MRKQLSNNEPSPEGFPATGLGALFTREELGDMLTAIKADTVDQILPSWENKLLEELEECTFHPQLSATARARRSRPRQSFASEMHLDSERRSESHRDRQKLADDMLKSWFVPEIEPYSRGLHFDSVAHQRLHKCWGAQLREHLQREAETCVRIRSVTTSPPPRRRSPRPPSPPVTARPQSAVPAASDNKCFQASNSSTSIVRKRIRNEFTKAVGQDQERISRERMRNVMATMGFVSKKVSLIPSEVDALQRAYELLDPTDSGSVSVPELLNLVEDLVVGNACNDVRLIALKFGRISRSHCNSSLAHVEEPESTVPIQRRLRRVASTSRLLQISAKTKQRIADIKRQQEKKFRAQCTFRPLMRKMPSSLTRSPKKRFLIRQLSQTQNLPLSHLLHNDFNKKKEKLQRLQEEARRKDEEHFRKTCPFKPTIPKVRSLSPRSKPAALPQGFQNYVYRVRNAAAIADAMDQVRVQLIDQQAQKKHAEFRQNQLFYEKRIAARLQREKTDNRRVMCVLAIQLSPTETQHIQVREGDDPDTLARRFCKQYQLPTWARTDLRARLSEQLKMSSVQKSEASPSIEDIADWDIDQISNHAEFRQGRIFRINIVRVIFEVCAYCLEAISRTNDG